MGTSEHQPVNQSSVLHAMNVTLTAVLRIRNLIEQEAPKLDPAVFDEISSYLGDLEKLLNQQLINARYEAGIDEPWDEDDDAIAGGWNNLKQRIVAAERGQVA